MVRFQSSKLKKSLLLIGLLALWGWFMWSNTARVKDDASPDTAANPLVSAWQLAQAVGQYDFSVEAQQILRPRPIPGMIGQSGQAVDINIEGEALSAVSAQMTVKLDGAGLDSTPVTLLQEGSQTWLIKGDEKKLTQNPVGVMAPTGSYISYLAAADNVQPCEQASALAGAAACYTFDINGPHFADYIRDQLQTAIDHDPTARPMGAAVQVAPSPQLMRMTGSGMVILDARNLPLRMVLDIETPEVDQFFDGKNHAVVDFEFDPEAVEVAMVTQSAAEPFWRHFIPTDLDFSGLLVFALTLFPAGLMLVWHRRRWFYGLVVVLVIGSMVSTPLVQAAEIVRFEQRQTEAAQTLAETFTAATPAGAVPVEPAAGETVPAAAPVFEPDAYCGKDSDVNRDSDGDGLADDAEYCLGTNPFAKDSDSDGLSDGVETTGFDFGGQKWYSDPLKPDSNADGLNDSVEWKVTDGVAADWDIDSDGTPNLWDYDDDGDGVDDGLDASPYSATDFLAQDEFTFDVIGQYDSYVYIDMQLQPENLDHLRYGVTPLNWLSDWRGQITDMDFSQDDIELIPMLEVDTNIPPGRDLADEYNVSVFTDTMGIGFQRMNIPLYPVSDGGKVQAFSFRLVYGPDQLQTLGDDGIHWAHARLVWSVRAKLDKDVNGHITTKTSPVHMYAEDAFRLTGWSVTKSGPYRSALIGTPDTPANDRDLFQVLFGLSSSFLTNPSITLDEVNNRLSGINTPIEQRWGVSANVKVDLPLQPDAHQSAGLVAMNNRINSFLGAHYPGDTPHTVIIAAESEMGMVDQDDLGLLMPDSTKLSVNLRNVSMARQRTLTLHMRDGTKAVQGDKLLSVVLARYVNDVDTALDDLTDQYPLLTAGDLVAIMQTMYLTWENGRTRLLSFDGAVSNPATLTDTEIYKLLYTTPRDRYGEPENIATLPGYLVEVGRFARENSGMIFSGGPGQVWQYLQGNATEAMILGFAAGATQFIKQAADAIASAIGDAQRLNEIPYIDLSGYTENKYSVIDEANNAIGMAMTAIGTADTAFGIAEATLDLTGDAAKAAGKAAKWGAKVTKYAKIGGKISKFLGPASLGVEIALIWTTFIMNAIMTGEFSMQALAMAIAATILAIVLFLISTIPVWVAGAIIAVVGLVDLVLSLIPGIDFTITGTVTKYLAGWFYEERVLTEIGDTKFLGGGQGLIDEEMGYVVGNRYIITDTFVGSIKQTAAKGISVTGGKDGVVGEGGVALDRRALELSFICAEYVLDEDATVKDNTVPRNRCKPGQWRFQRTYNYTDKTVTFTNPMVIMIPFDRPGEHNLEYQTQIVARTTNYVSSMYGVMSGGYKNMTITLPKDMPKKKQWEPMELYLDILPNTVEGLWGWRNGAAANPDPDGDGLLLADELILSVGLDAFNAYVNSLPNGISGWEEGYADMAFSDWDNDPIFRADICARGGTWAQFCEAGKTVPWLAWDYDGDGLGDKFEVDENGKLGTDPHKFDTDGDGLNDGLEYRMGTRIDLADTDLDGLTDGEEAFYLKDDGTLNGGWDITVYKPGAVGPSGRYTTTVKVYSDPRSADADGDGLSDLEEQTYGTSPNAYNRMPKVDLTGSPFAVSPSGAEAIYVKPGANLTFKASLQSFVPYTVAGTLSVDMPWHLLSTAQFTGFSGDSSPANTGAGGNPEWSFAADPLLPGEEAHTSFTAQTAGSQSMTGTATIKLPLEASGWRPFSGGLNHSQYVSSVSALALDPTKPNVLYAGGLFNAAGGRPASNIARWNGSSWAALGAGVDGTVYAAVVDSSGQLYVGGNFTHAGGQAANRIAKWTGTAWEPLGDGFNDWVYGLAFDSGGNLYAVGDFTKSGTTALNGVAKWNGSSWAALGSGVDNMDESWVKTIAIDSNDNVYIGGHFYSVSGVNAAHAAKWNGSSWAKMGDIYGGGGLSGSIKTMVVSPATDELYAGGDIWQIDSQDAKSGIFKWTGSNWQILPYVPVNPDTSGGHKTNALTFDADGTLYAGGTWPLNGGGTQYIGRWDGSAWSAFGQPAGSSASAYLIVNALVSDGDGLTVGGTFDSVADIPAKNIAYYLTTDSQIQEDSVTVVVDAELPRVGLTSPRHGQLLGGGVTDYVIGGFSSDVTSWVTKVDLSLPNGSPTIDRTPDMTLSPWAYTWNLPADGVYDLSATATDFVGWTASPSTAQVMVDNTAPTANISYPAQDQAIGPPQGSDVITITVTGSAADTWSGLTRVQISTDDSPWREVWTSENPTANTTYTDHSATFRHHATAAGWAVDWTLPNVESVQGYHSVKARAFDLAGNEPEIQEITFIIDVIPPTDELTNRAYLYDYPHLPVGVANPLRGVANDVGHVPQPARPDDLIGTLDSINNATIWLGLDSIAEDDAGVTVNWIGDFNGDRRGDLLVGTPASAGGAGRVNVVYGRAGDWTVPDGQEMISDNYTSFVGTPGAGIGQYAIPAGDVNGDGIADLLVGDPVNNSVYVIFGKPFYYGRDIVLDGYQAGRRVLLTVPEGRQIGSHIGAAGDVNGDGIDDILIGVTDGPAYLLLGMEEAWREIVPLEVFNAATISGAGNATLAGVGDLDGDFYDEFAVGLNGISVFNGKATYANQGRQSLSTGSADLSFGSADGQPGLARLGDVTGDQRDDFIFTTGGSQNLVSGGGVIHTYSYGAGFVAAPGDVDNDGLNDILIGGNGDAHLVLAGNLSGTQATISGVAAAASTLYAAGADLNSDGSSDLLLLPTAVGGVAASDASSAALPNLPPAWIPRLPEQNLPTYTDNTDWSVSGADAYVNNTGDCHGQSPCHSTIQAAVNSINSTGQLISVQPGVYAPFTIDGSSSTKTNLTVRGVNPDAVFVDAGGSGAAATISNANGVRLEQMTLRNASYGVQLTNAGVGGHKSAELSKRAIFDHLLIYDVGSYDVYMDRSSTLTVTRSTLVNTGNQVGVNMSSDFDSTVTVGWQAETDTPDALYEGGDLVAFDQTLFYCTGNGGGTCKVRELPGGWTTPWAPLQSPSSLSASMDPGTAIGAGPDDQFYVISAPGWNALGTPNSSMIAADVVVAPNGHVFIASSNSGSFAYENGAVWEWDGSQWITYRDNIDDSTPLGGNKYKIDLNPTNGDVYISGGWDWQDVARWDNNNNGWVSLDAPEYTGLKGIDFTSDGTLYATSQLSGVLRYNGSSWAIVGDPAVFGTDGKADALYIAPDDNIYAAGLASQDVYEYPYIGKWNGSSWTSVGYPVAWDDPATIKAMTTDANGALYVCGHFGDSGVAKNTGGSSWELLPAIPGDTGLYQDCDDIAFNGSIYVAGEWQSSDGSNDSPEKR